MFSFFKPLEACFKSQQGCGWAELEPFINAILRNLVVIGMFVAACTVAYAGWTLLKGQGDPGSRSKARQIFINVIVGTIILFSAYFIVDLILTKLLVNKEYRQNI